MRQLLASLFFSLSVQLLAESEGLVCNRVAMDVKPCVISESEGRREGELVFYDARHLPLEGRGWQATDTFYERLPSHAKGRVREVIWSLSRESSGMLHRFQTNASKFVVRWTLTSDRLALHNMAATGVSGVDLYGLDSNGEWIYIHSVQRPKSGINEVSVDVGDQRYREFILYLPARNGVRSVELGIPEGSALGYLEAERPVVVIYGTSITQGECASRPGMTFTAMLGRRLNVEMINLGFSGNGRLEPEVAELFAELDPACFIIDPLRNNGIEQLRERYEPFLRILLRAHPDTPILLADESQFDDRGANEKSRIVQEVMHKLQAEGARNLLFLPNNGMLGTDGEGTVDGVHPNDIGMQRMADTFTPVVQQLLKHKNL